MLRVQALDEIAAEIARRSELTAALAALPPQIDSGGGGGQNRGEERGRRTQESFAQARSAMQALKVAYDAVAFDEPLYSLIEATFAQVGDARRRNVIWPRSPRSPKARRARERWPSSDEDAARAAHLRGR